MRLEDLPPKMREQAMAALGEPERPKKNRKGATRVATDGWCATCREHFTSTAVWEKHCDANPGHSRFELIWTALRDGDEMAQRADARKRTEAMSQAECEAIQRCIERRREVVRDCLECLMSGASFDDADAFLDALEDRAARVVVG